MSLYKWGWCVWKDVEWAVAIYRRSGFDCVVKRLRMALYKPDCDSNDCELPSGQATPSILASFRPGIAS